MSSGNTKGLFEPVKSDVNFPALEQSVLAYWDLKKIFEKSLEGPVGDKPYSFYDGPPFATGLPHYGHILAGVLKDIVPRFWTMQGFKVARRFGWDCHGLPVENEINKTLKVENRKQVLEMGIDKYNAACRGIVTRYAGEWKKTVKRVGRWVDMENAYFTMDVSFMQSVWWVFQELYKKGLIYQGYKVVPYSTGISTTLSNFEAGLNYKDVQDPALTVMFEITHAKGAAQLGDRVMAWTTTPWTLPSNMALAVGSQIEYVRVKEKSSGRVLWVALSRLDSVFKSPSEEAEVLESVKGAELLGARYVPLFDYFSEKGDEGAFRIIHSDHVTTESGTGVVHIAPAYGEDDYYACLKHGIPLVNPVDDDGVFTADVKDFQGLKVKDADKGIAQFLKQKGLLFKQETLMHSYPFCWRTDTPLIYRAVSSWFVAVEKIKAEMLASNAETAWVPDHLKDGRFGKWLEGARDWAISRNRFWGTPIPIWQNPEGERICVGSREELEKLTGAKVSDLHMEFIDKLTIPSPTGKSPLTRISDVLDCWFESGSMPMAQWGYPFENKPEFEKAFPADFIAEGLDQTRGWFYTLTVIGTALYGRAPFKNVVVNGLVLAEDGKKMSKSLKNYPDPLNVIDAHGADALRLYLIDSPVVKAQELRFSEKGVRDVVRKILLRWWNSYAFFVNYANIDDFKPKGDAKDTPNILDQWVLSRLNTLIASTESEMKAYRLYNVVPGLLQFVEELTNTYIRFNRSVFWQDGMPETKRYAYETLYEVLTTVSKLMAPFTPFLAETTYLNLSKALGEGAKESVHLEAFPKPTLSLVQPKLEDAVARMERLVMLGRNLREKIEVKAKIPLNELRVIHRSKDALEELKRVEAFFADELNVRKVTYHSDEENWVQVSAKANFKTLGKRVGGKMKAIAAAVERFDIEQIANLESGAMVPIEGELITLSDVEIRRAAKGDRPTLLADALVTIELDPTVTEESRQEGLAREVLRKVQAARKEADFRLDDRIELSISCGGDIRTAVEKFREMICSEALVKRFEIADSGSVKDSFVSEVELEEGKIKISIARTQA